MAKKSIKQFDEKNDEQVYVSVRETLESARGKVERAVNSVMVDRGGDGRAREVREASPSVLVREVDG